jgi:hypothetical protein
MVALMQIMPSRFAATYPAARWFGGALMVEAFVRSDAVCCNSRAGTAVAVKQRFRHPRGVIFRQRSWCKAGFVVPFAMRFHRPVFYRAGAVHRREIAAQHNTGLLCMLSDPCAAGR